MAKTIFNASSVARPVSRGPSFIGMDPRPPAPIPSQKEEGEPEVASAPLLGRPTLNYLEPRKGTDAPGDFRSCASCRAFVPERAFRAATTGNHCVILGNFPVEPYANCSHYAPWPMGKPIESVVESNALCCLNGARASLSPYDVGYDEDRDHSHKCRSCRQFDPESDDADDGAEGPHCEFFEQLNRSLPKIFQVNESVDPDGGCSAWTEMVPDEPYSSD